MGVVKTATIQSGIEPVLPGPPSRLAVSNIEAFSVVLQFTPGFDGNSSVTKWTVQVRIYKTASSSDLMIIFLFAIGQLRPSHRVTAHGTPFTKWQIQRQRPLLSET